MYFVLVYPVTFRDQFEEEAVEGNPVHEMFKRFIQVLISLFLIALDWGLFRERWDFYSSLGLTFLGLGWGYV